MTATSVRIAVMAVLVALTSGRAYAQHAPLHRVDVSFSGGIFGPGSLGSSDATLRANSAATQRYRLFSTGSRLGTAALLEGRLAFNLSKRLSVEGRFGYSRPEVRTSVAADAEGTAALTVVERIDQFAIDGGINVHVDEWRLAGFTPFVTAGAGYLRQLHAGQTLVEQGHSYFVGGGVTRPLMTRTQHLIKTVGVRGDGRLDLLVGGIGAVDRRRPHASLSGGIVLGF